MQSTRSADRIAMAVLAMLVIIAFANVVFGGKTLVPSENFNPLDGHAREDAAEWERRDVVPFANTHDEAAAMLQFEPSREFLRRSLQRGEFPFWDPYIGGGHPSFASLVPAYLFPPSLLVVLLGNGSLVKNLYILFLIFTSGTLTYFLLRRHGLSWPAALAGAIAFSFSGAIIQTAPTSGLGQPAALFSLPLIVTARLIEKPSARRAAQLAMAFAFVALASFPPILVQSFGMCVVYLITALIAATPNRAAVGRWFFAGTAVSLAIVGVAYLPAMRLLAEVPHVTNAYAFAAAGTMRPRFIAQLLSPTIMGGSAVYMHPAVVGTTGVHMHYTGVVALLLAGIGFVSRAAGNARVLKITATICGALALAKIFGVPPVQWIAHVPLLRTIHYAAYFGILVAYAIAILAAIGLDALLGGHTHRWQIAASASVLALALVILRVAAWLNGVESHPQGWRWIADFRLLVVFGAITVIAAWMRRRNVATALILATLAIEGVTNAAYPRAPRRDIWAHPPEYIELLNRRNTGGRLLPMPSYPANTESVFRQPAIDTLLFSSTRMHDLYQRYFCAPGDFFLRGARCIPPEGVLDAANIEYFAIGTPERGALAEAERRGYETLYADDLLRLVRRPAEPRYRFTSTYQLATKSDALAALATRPRGSVVLEQRVSFASKVASGAEVHPRVTRFELNEVELVVDAPRPGLIVCSESNMSGWTATVDRHPARILAADYAFRAVEVPRGAHTVRFAYDPPGLEAGLIATAIGVVVCGIGLIVRRPE